MLACPKCKSELVKKERIYACGQNHVYDIAKRGYVNLLLGNHKVSGDDKEMMLSRTQFLSNGYYQPLCDSLIQILKEIKPNIMVDAGCGEGFYTNQFAKAFPSATIFGFDLSKHGVDQACKAHQKVTYGVANVFHLPILDQCTDVVLSIFAPFDGNEIHRVLKDDGYFIKVGPGPKHLLDLKQVLYDNVYENEADEQQNFPFQFVKETYLEYNIQINNSNDIWSLFQMTPYYWKSPKAGSERLRALETLETKIHFHIQVYKK